MNPLNFSVMFSLSKLHIGFGLFHYTVSKIADQVYIFRPLLSSSLFVPSFGFAFQHLYIALLCLGMVVLQISTHGRIV